MTDPTKLEWIYEWAYKGEEFSPMVLWAPYHPIMNALDCNYAEFDTPVGIYCVRRINTEE